ncbi:25150_t:CDS:2, partial [Dentiscutata erythropus]
SRSRSRDKPSQNISSICYSYNTKYLSINDLPYNLRVVIRHQVFWIIKRMPAQSQLKLDQIFSSQKDLVNNTIVSTVMSTLDLEMFPVSEAIMYDMIHHCHKHKHEEHLFKQQPIKRTNRSKTIEHLRAINDLLVRLFRNRELRPIKNSNRYHLPEVSKTDEENPSGKKKVVTKDLRWRSTTDTVGYYEKELSKPFLAPNWLVSGYEG